MSMSYRNLIVRENGKVINLKEWTVIVYAQASGSLAPELCPVRRVTENLVTVGYNNPLTTHFKIFLSSKEETKTIVVDINNQHNRSGLNAVEANLPDTEAILEQNFLSELQSL